MAAYLFTSLAGRRVAGRKNTGVGTTVDLTADEAAAPLAAGEIVAAGAGTDADETPDEQAAGATGGKGRGKKKAGAKAADTSGGA